ncbi:TlpA family protein disulfide reductase [Spirosoma sp. KCTC 42546]|uniref:TlpA family protein disulfide reductase n=1 Tax=Spirosoma sp. KCTC 42546 TaxID=2520506 RepID=UPI00115AE529|nr:TlpA disulfide reductase family protein [Spirosoma sp. KCTC 42546]QDK79801.1 TlpA family protein disulfide reductase [Spirosoma sp. KCTC 42546]
MNVFKFTLLLCLINLGQTFAQSIYQGPQPEALFTTASDKAFLADFRTKFKADFDTTSQYAKLRTSGLDAWEMSLFDARKTQSAYYKSYPKASELSEGFKQYVEACIRWNYWHLLLAYPILRGNAQTAQSSLMSLPSVMVEDLAALKVNDESALSAEPYQDFLFFYVTYFNSKARNFAKYTSTDIQNSLTDKATFARQHLTGKPYQYTLARLLVENCDKTPPSSVRAVFAILSATPNAVGYVSVVKARCGEVMAKKDEPVVAADAQKKTIDPKAFSFANQNGEPVTLDEYKGKVVYLDVWASWCGPCRAEFPYSKQLQERLSKKQKEQVVFLYLSIDDTEEVWKKALATLQLQGEQGLSKGGWKSKTVKYFGIQSIPRYILINKNGQVADADAKRPSMTDAILQDIIKLLGE